RTVRVRKVTKGLSAATQHVPRIARQTAAHPQREVPHVVEQGDQAVLIDRIEQTVEQYCRQGCRIDALAETRQHFELLERTDHRIEVGLASLAPLGAQAVECP